MPTPSKRRAIDKDKLLKITLDNGFVGQTSKGLRIGDTIEKAVQIYGKPDSKSSMHLKWDKLVIYTLENIVTNLRLKM